MAVLTTTMQWPSGDIVLSTFSDRVVNVIDLLYFLFEYDGWSFNCLRTQKSVLTYLGAAELTRPAYICRTYPILRHTGLSGFRQREATVWVNMFATNDSQ
jgi:hypothetical protein